MDELLSKDQICNWSQKTRIFNTEIWATSTERADFYGIYFLHTWQESSVNTERFKTAETSMTDELTQMP